MAFEIDRVFELHTARARGFDDRTAQRMFAALLDRCRQLQHASCVGVELGKDVPHRREQQFVLGAEIMVRQRRRHAGAAGYLRHGHVQRTALADRRDRRVDERLATQRFHSDFRHLGIRFEARLFFIDGSINKNREINRSFCSGPSVGLENGSLLNNIESCAAAGSC